MYGTYKKFKERDSEKKIEVKNPTRQVVNYELKFIGYSKSHFPFQYFVKLRIKVNNNTNK